MRDVFLSAAAVAAAVVVVAVEEEVEVEVEVAVEDGDEEESALRPELLPCCLSALTSPSKSSVLQDKAEARTDCDADLGKNLIVCMQV